MLITLLLLHLTFSTVRAQGFVGHFEPPAVERGKTTRVVVVGTNLGRAIDLWNTLPSGAMKATPVGESTSTRAEFDVAVAKNAPVGVCGVRLATADGLANACLFHIDDLPVRPAPQEGKIALPAAVCGRFREAAVDRFVIDVAAGQTISFEAVANRLGKDVDPLITIRDANGRLVVQRDNDAGLYFDFRFEHTFTEAGAYTVELSDARFLGNEHGFFVLRMGRFPAARVALPAAVASGKTSEVRLSDATWTTANVVAPPALGAFTGNVRRPGDQGSAWLPLEATDAPITDQPGLAFETAAPAAVPGVICSVLRKPLAKHHYLLELGKGQKIVVHAETRALNSPADLEVTLLDMKNNVVRRTTENAQKEELSFDFTAGNPGVYVLAVRDINRDGGPNFAYRLDVRGSSSQAVVTADVEGLTLPRGGYQTVPLTVARTDYSGPIGLSLIGAPEGVTLTPTEIESGVNAVVCRLTASDSAALGTHTIQIQAKPATAPASLVRGKPLIDRLIFNVDLIQHALREDQRRLPPALTDRFAVQVTLPSPFTVELPETLVTLGRYQNVKFPIVTTRTAGFDGPITFAAKGGQIAPKEEGRTRVYAELPPATANQAQATATIHSLILTNTQKHRVDLTATGTHQGRRVSLTRTFDLDVRPAYLLSAEPATVKAEPGDLAKVRLKVDRMKTFAGDVMVNLSPQPGLTLPERLVIPAGQTGVEIDVKIDPTSAAAKRTINLNASATVSGYEEEQRGQFTVDIVRTPPAKK